ncbi:MAG: helix-turn-helix transcriptional regulator [Alphaproteobacteria bacterium]|nr:helix-turn-helix transcriptional regulator [Alphaproteobacteria bacterium]
MDPRVRIVTGLMRENLDRPWPTEKLAGIVGLSATHLRRLFRSETGVNLSQYGRQLRMTEACRLLQTTFLSVKQVAAKAGAGDVSHFVRSFEKTYGMSPTQYRRRVSVTQDFRPESARMAELANE